MDYKDILYIIAFISEILGAIFIAKNFLSLKLDQLIKESASGWSISSNPDYLKRMLYLREETKIGVCLILSGFVIKLIAYLSEKPYNLLPLYIIIIGFSFIFLLFLCNNIIQYTTKKIYNNTTIILIKDGPNTDDYIAKIADIFITEITRGHNESDSDFANRVRKFIER